MLTKTIAASLLLLTLALPAGRDDSLAVIAYLRCNRRTVEYWEPIYYADGTRAGWKIRKLLGDCTGQGHWVKAIEARALSPSGPPPTPAERETMLILQRGGRAATTPADSLQPEYPLLQAIRNGQ